MKFREDIGKFLNDHQLCGRGVEVGVFAGDFSLSILKHWRGEKLLLVDPWCRQPPREYQDEHNVAQPQFDALFSSVPLRLSKDAGRYEIMRAFSHEAAQYFADESVDFVYIDANHSYRNVRQDLRDWYPKLKLNGLMAGNYYLDAVVGPNVFGVKSAVDELAAEHGHQVRVTLDKWPTWFFIKRDQRLNATQRIALLTAYDHNQRDVAEWSIPNRRAYCARHGYDFIEETTGFPIDRAPYWGKIRFLQKHLPRYDWVFWSDNDTLIMRGDVRLEEFIDCHYDLIICHEDLGKGLYNVNVGQMFFRNTPWSLRFLQEVWDQTQFLNDKLPEQRAMIHLIWSRDLSKQVQLVTQRRFNSYPTNYRPGDFLIHFLDMKPERRISLMRHYEQFAQL